MLTKLATLVVVVVGLVSACATSFTGDPHYPGGPAACNADCSKGNMAMAAFVYSGEFASSCVCRPLGPAAVAPDDDDAAAEADVAAALVGVELARRAREAAARSGR
jgi:hypothetical protein